MTRPLLLVFPLLLLATGSHLTACQVKPGPEQAFFSGDYAAAHGLWHVSALAGDSRAQNFLGILYHLGLGVPRDLGRAVDWYTASAYGGNADAQRNLGTMYQFGLGVREDGALAYAWYHSSHGLGNHRASDYIKAMGNQLTPNQKLAARAKLRQALIGVPNTSDGQ